jgi:hypothetical protein
MAKTNDGFAVADRVQHAQYGLGKITEVNARYVTIEFDEAGVKKFIADMVRLKRSDTPAPEKPARKSRAKAAKKS